MRNGSVDSRVTAGKRWPNIHGHTTGSPAARRATLLPLGLGCCALRLQRREFFLQIPPVGIEPLSDLATPGCSRLEMLFEHPLGVQPGFLRQVLPRPICNPLFVGRQAEVIQVAEHLVAFFAAQVLGVVMDVTVRPTHLPDPDAKGDGVHLI